MQPVIIYNLFPRLAGDMRSWPSHAERARAMGFDWIYLNPIQYPGFSGSLYAIKDFYRLNPLFIPPECTDPDGELRSTLQRMHQMGLSVMLDLVINHTSRDSLLATAHPEWFVRDEQGELVRPSAIDPADTRRVTVWGDLADVDNAGAPGRQALWEHWASLVRHLLELGFDGFRCDAAYQVPAGLWQQLIDLAHRLRPGVLFVAETLGCRLPEVRALLGAGFDYLLNSSKYWHFDRTWALEQHAEFGALARSISFPESHDTPRLMHETCGLVSVQKQRYVFAACFSAGLLMPLGYELGFTRKLDVVTSSPADWEQTDVDLGPFIGQVNRLKRTLPLLGVEGRWDVVTTLQAPTTVLRKRADGIAGAVVLGINKDWHQGQELVLPPVCRQGIAHPVLHRPFSQGPAGPLPPEGTLQLEPAEVVIIEL